VRSDRLGDPGATSDPSDNSGRAVTVQTVFAGAGEDRSLGALADGQIYGPGGVRRDRNGDDLAALAQNGQGAV
jgi:hypothetical protein